MRIRYPQLKAEFKRVLISLNFSETRADACAETFAANSRDGIVSHGLNRFPVFVQYVKEGLVIPDAEPSPVSSLGAIEQWDGNLGGDLQQFVNLQVHLFSQYKTNLQIAHAF